MKDGYVELQVGGLIYQIPAHKKTEAIALMVGFESKEALAAEVANERLTEAKTVIGAQTLEIQRLEDVVGDAGEKLMACTKQLEGAMEINNALFKLKTHQ